VGELDLDALLNFFRKNPWLAAVAIYLIASFLRAITRVLKGDAAKTKTARAPDRRVADVDLQERVRAGFEQMLRERAAGRGAAARREPPPVPSRPFPAFIARARPARSAGRRRRRRPAPPGSDPGVVSPS
jgi:hypothetical protein